MYESPKELIRDFVPTPIVSFTVVARAAGVFYLASIILPMVSSRIGFAEYTSGFFAEARALSTPFDLFELLFIATLGTVSGVGETYEAAGGGAGGVGVAALDFIITPVLYVGLPVTGFLLTAGIVVLGIAFLLGYNRYTTHLTMGFLMIYVGYIAMFGMKTATLHPKTGLFLMYFASLLMFIVVVDRAHEIGLVADNGYSLSTNEGPNTNRSHPRPLVDKARISTGVSTIVSKSRELSGRSNGISEKRTVTDTSKPDRNDNNVDSNTDHEDRQVESKGKSETESKNGSEVSYAGSAKRRS